jgi:hypothetical protein
MIWLLIVVIILIIWYVKSYKHEEKFSNPPSINDVDFLKNYIKVSKYTLDQSAKKINNDANAKFTTANTLLNSIDDIMSQITALKNGTENTVAGNNSILYINQLIMDINTYNNILGLSQNVINHYNEFNDYINNNSNGLNYAQKLYLVSNVLTNIKDDLLKYVINQSILKSNILIDSLNSLAPNVVISDDDKSINFSSNMPTEIITPLTMTNVIPTIVKNPTDVYTNIYPYGTGKVTGSTDFDDIDLATWKGTLDQCKVMCSNNISCNGFARNYNSSDNVVDYCFAKKNSIYSNNTPDSGKIKVNNDYTDATNKYNQWIKNPNDTANLTLRYNNNDININRYINIYPYGYGLDSNDPNYNNIDLRTIQNVTLDQCKVNCNANSNCNGFARDKKLSYNTPGDCYLKTNITLGDGYKNANRKYNTGTGFNNWIKSSTNSLNIIYPGDNQSTFTY